MRPTLPVRGRSFCFCARSRDGRKWTSATSPHERRFSTSGAGHAGDSSTRPRHASCLTQTERLGRAACSRAYRPRRSSGSELRTEKRGTMSFNTRIYARIRGALTAGALAALAGVGATGCAATVTATPVTADVLFSYPIVRVESPPPRIYERPHMQYQGREAYLVDG